MEEKYFVSICIPSYNRPDTLIRAIDSIYSITYADSLQIVICEDFSPKRLLIRAAVEEYRKKCKYALKYIENKTNLGHGKNWRHCCQEADGKYLIYLGDDDMFLPSVLDTYLDWLKHHSECGYVLRSWASGPYRSKELEYFRYFNEDKFFQPGVDAYKAMFNKSVSMSGYTVRRDCALNYLYDGLDDTLLYQLYLMAEVCLHYPSAYCNLPFVHEIGDQVPEFGNSKSERGKYMPGQLSGNVFYIKGFSRIAKYIDAKYNIQTADSISLDLSKYSYFILAYQYNKYGKDGMKIFAKELREIGLDSSFYFNIYYWSLCLVGPSICSSVIKWLKKLIGHRPQL